MYDSARVESCDSPLTFRPVAGKRDTFNNFELVSVCISRALMALFNDALAKACSP